MHVKNITTKLRLHIVLPVALAAGLVSCSEDLDMQPENAISPDQISEQNIDLFLNGLYRLSTPGRDNYVIHDIRGGNYTWTALSGNNSSYGILISGNSVDDGLSFSSSVWVYAYEGIYAANNVINAADRLEPDAAIQTVKGEACYLRAYLYYQLVTLFGGVPLILENTTENLPRNDAAEIWSQIQADLDFAIAHTLPIGETGYSRISSEAAQALKARVLLALDDQAGAAELARDVIQSTGIDPDNNYGAIFRNTESAGEVLFAFANLQTETNIRMSALFWPYGTTWAGSYFVQPSDYALNELYNDEDVRRGVNIQRIDNSDGTHQMIVSKYQAVQPMVVSRISELYLICAEGLPGEEGLNYLNDLREARGLDRLPAQATADAEDYLDLVLEERRRELFSEGFLFYDLVRTGKALDLPNISNENQYLLPLPGSQVALSNGVLEQNEGY